MTPPSEPQEETRSVATDTATLVVFDPASLVAKTSLECDWWTGDGDLEHEESAGSLAFIDTRSDGIFELRIRIGGSDLEGIVIKRSILMVPSGELLFGAGECLPGEGEAMRKYLGSLVVRPGTYSTVAYRLKDSANGVPAFGIHLIPSVAG